MTKEEENEFWIKAKNWNDRKNRLHYALRNKNYSEDKREKCFNLYIQMSFRVSSLNYPLNSITYNHIPK